MKLPFLREPKPVPAARLDDPHDLSLVQGGPLFQFARRGHLCGDALEPLRRRSVDISLVAWSALLVLSVVDGRAWDDVVRVPFLHLLQVVV